MRNISEDHNKEKAERHEIQRKLMADIPATLEAAVESYLEVPLPDHLSETSLNSFGRVLTGLRLLATIDLEKLKTSVSKKLQSIGERLQYVPFSEEWLNRMAVLRDQIISTADYALIEQYAKRFGSSDKENLDRLWRLLRGNGWNLSSEESGYLLLCEEQEIRRRFLTERIISGDTLTFENALRRYLELFSIEDHDLLADFAYSLKEFGFSEIDSADGTRPLIGLLVSRLKKLSNEIELEKFRNQLLAGDSPISFNEIDLMLGHEFEEFLNDLFMRIGFEVYHTPLTGDQGADLVLTKFGETTVLQAKRSQTPVGNRCVQEVVGAIGFYSAHKGIVVTNNYFTSAAKELAKMNGVELVDRDSLQKLINAHM